MFHVCHDVLVSSFLCPIGSTFSQKLLTCDWWTKVDCSSSDKYMEANRNSYQQDDDEMIRNAYAMISLRSGTDVTEDGLVDPDSIGRAVNYRQLAGRISDYASEVTAGNDLRNNLEEYARRDPSPPYRFENNPERSQSYRGMSYARQRSQSPYKDSPIIRVQPIYDRLKSEPFQKHYPRPNQFNNQFQPSYAPTVPTVTTTTRRFYSPTVPTTFRPSTLPYNKLDQTIGGSDYFFSRGSINSFTTPPSSIPSGDDHTHRQIFKTPPRVVYEFRYDQTNVNNTEESSNRSERPFQSVPTDQANLRQPHSFIFDRIRQRIEQEDQDIETGDSVGLGHALRQSLRGISSEERIPGKDKTGPREIGSTVVAPSLIDGSQYYSHSPQTNIHSDYQHTLARPGFIISVDENEQGGQSTEQYQGNDKKDGDSKTFSPLTISHSFAESDVKETPINLSAKENEATDLSTTASNNLHDNATGHLELELSNEKESIDRMDVRSRALGPTEFREHLDRTPSKFQIKVPDLSVIRDKNIEATTAFPTSFYSLEDGTVTAVPEEAVTEQPNTETLTSLVTEGTRTVQLFKTDRAEPLKPKKTMNNQDLVESPTANAFESIRPEIVKDTNNFTVVVGSDDSKQQNIVNLFRLMSELLKLNRAPRPFSLANARSEFHGAEAIGRDANLSVEKEETASATPPRSSTHSVNESPLVLSKKEILDRLMENFGKSLHTTDFAADRQIASDLPERQRVLDFRAGLPTNASNNYLESSITETTLSTSPEFSETSTRTSPLLPQTTTASTIVATPTPKVTITTESAETLVKTEFLPSIGFSFDTEEGREEYVEAVLGGLIEPQPVETEKKEAIVSPGNEKGTYSRNETSRAA